MSQVLGSTNSKAASIGDSGSKVSHEPMTTSARAAVIAKLDWTLGTTFSLTDVVGKVSVLHNTSCSQ